MLKATNEVNNWGYATSPHVVSFSGHRSTVPYSLLTIKLVYTCVI